MFCPSCGTQNDSGANYCVKCGARLQSAAAAGPAPVFPAQAFPAHAANDGPIYAGFWKRLVAYVIDWIVLYVVFVAASLVLGPVLGPGFDTDAMTGRELMRSKPWLFLVLGAIPWLYYALMESSARQATVGKLALGIRVIDLSGRRISFLRATARFFGRIVSSMIFGIGYLMAAFTARKQALHDMIAGCLVVNKRFASGDAAAAYAHAPRKTSGGVVALIALAVLVFAIGLIGLVAYPSYQDYGVRSKVSDMGAIGNAATRAVNDYYTEHQALPDDLASTGFTQSNRHVESVTFDRQSRTIVVIANFAPVEGQRLLFVALSPGDAPRILWRCTSAGIPNRYLPPTCRSVTTRL